MMARAMAALAVKAEGLSQLAGENANEDPEKGSLGLGADYHGMEIPVEAELEATQVKYRLL